ncbi:hypothetical protein [Parvicella tangerina]|uniref:Uncharacterized protein n=1 Tax=Parvicella tangerina TaxID=2829795 RepID=A0A916JRL3_9FLAO|nr:hypothetical protein [Parvicella tangerina]CAG5087614.1 hypothetical protein CRYO30217_03527 [Parvicella tangerina]
MRLSVLIIFLLVSSSIFSQKEVLEFQLSKPENGIQVNMLDSSFQVGDVNPFQVLSTGSEPILKVEVFRGNVHYNPMGWYEVSFKKAGPTFIKVFCKNSRGEPYLAMTKPVDVQPLPTPEVFICDVKNDSALNIEHLIKNRKITAKMRTPDQFKYHPAVLSFRFSLGKDTISVKGNEIPFSYKSKLYDLKDGGTFSIYDVKVMLPNKNKNVVIVPKVSVFLINTDQYSVGERRYIGN